MILIADSGSTKTDWILSDGEKKLGRYSTVGFNPYFVTSDAIYEHLQVKLSAQLDATLVKNVFFYGAGCSTAENISIANRALEKFFTNARVSVGHDMLAAARALLGNHRGFAAIIGTGSNTCIYDGEEVEKNIDSLGYLMGDEGSGSYIGKKIVRDYLRGYLPKTLEKKFTEYYSLKQADIFDALYNKPTPNRFLASFCKFADHNKEHEYIKKILRQSFTDFFENLVSHYPSYQKFSFNCVGSVGFIFKDQLKEVATNFNMRVGKLISSPIEDLVNYHLARKSRTTGEG
jgi:glucosamine kinase